MCSPQAALIDGNPAIAEAAAAIESGGGRGRARARGGRRDAGGFVRDGCGEQVWAPAAPGSSLARVDRTRDAAFRDVSIDRWHRKAQVQVGKMSGGGGGGGEMRAFNQSVSSQVASAMRIPDRLIRKSQPPAHLAPRRLGEPAAVAKAAPTGDRAEDLDEDDLEARAHAEARVEELRGLTPTFTSRCSRTRSGAALDSPPKPAKRRKIVDRRASKGGSRGTTQQKLVNFCAPVELEGAPWAEKIFGQLFAGG